MTERKMGAPFYGEGKPPFGFNVGDYVERRLRNSDAWGAGAGVLFLSDYQYRLEASHSYYTQHATLDDAATLERLKASYPGLAWPELPDRAEVIAREWVDDWFKGDGFGSALNADLLARWLASKLIAEGVLK